MNSSDNNRDDLQRKWIAAAKKLSKNPGAKVRCPNCSSEDLVTEDVVYKNGTYIDRYLICRACGARGCVTAHQGRGLERIQGHE